MILRVVSRETTFDFEFWIWSRARGGTTLRKFNRGEMEACIDQDNSDSVIRPVRGSPEVQVRMTTFED